MIAFIGICVAILLCWCIILTVIILCRGVDIDDIDTRLRKIEHEKYTKECADKINKDSRTKH